MINAIIVGFPCMYRGGEVGVPVYSVVGFRIM